MVTAVNQPSTSKNTFVIILALGYLIFEVEIKMIGAKYEIKKVLRQQQLYPLVEMDERPGYPT